MTQSLAKTKQIIEQERHLIANETALKVIIPVIPIIKEESKKTNENLQQLQAEIQYLKAQNPILIDELERKKKRKDLAKKTKEKEPRSAITVKDYEIALSFANSKKNLVQASDRVALCLFYLTGLRISNLGKIPFPQFQQFYGGNELIVSLIKTKNHKMKYMTYPYNSSYRYFFKQLKQEFQILFRNQKHPEDLVWDVSREILPRRIHSILKKTSVLTGQNYKSHSFRIAMCTDVANSFSLLQAQKILGHANISTTERYARLDLSKKDLKNIFRTIRGPQNLSKQEAESEEHGPEEAESEEHGPEEAESEEHGQEEAGSEEHAPDLSKQEAGSLKSV